MKPKPDIERFLPRYPKHPDVERIDDVLAELALAVLYVSPSTPIFLKLSYISFLQEIYSIIDFYRYSSESIDISEGLIFLKTDTFNERLFSVNEWGGWTTG